MIKYVLKRDNLTKVEYDREKIRIAIEKANQDVSNDKQVPSDRIEFIIECIEMKFGSKKDAVVKVEDIQDHIEFLLMKYYSYDIAKAYITYRYKREIIRNANTTDESILNLLRNTNDEVSRENSNKKAILNSTKRDLIAGEVSKDLSRRLLLPKKIVDAHDAGILHFHDMDYFMQQEFNCALPDFDDMLTNGFVINGVKVDTPKSFRVACTQITQAMACISSNQYGGQTFYSSVLGKFLAYTKEKFRKRITERYNEKFKGKIDDDIISSLIEAEIEDRMKEELKDGVQTIQYQINTLMTTNGQSPFVTIFMYLSENDPYIEENALIIEEIIRQRIEGVKNEAGVNVTPTFPKLVYVLTEDNCLNGGKYDYLTHLAAKCVSTRIYPDFISEKVMKENYDGEVFGCMGCVSENSRVNVKYQGISLTSDDVHMKDGKISFEEIWEILNDYYDYKEQIKGNPNFLYFDIPSDIKFEVYDSKLKDFTRVRRVIRNLSTRWVYVTLENGFVLNCTTDHPFYTVNKGVISAEELEIGDVALTNDGERKISSIILYEEYKYSYDFTTDSSYFDVNNIYTHNCRSFLSAWTDPTTGEKKWQGRFNSGVVTLNLPMLALDSFGDEDKFWELMEERLSLCYDALMCRHKALEGTVSDVSPIHWQHGAIARLKPGETIDELLHNGYSTMSLGYIGLYECVKYMTGFSHTEDIGREFSLRVMNRLRAATDSWKASTKIAFGLYGTPAESTCYSLCEKIKKKYGEVENVTTKGYLTNSYHIVVTEPINAFDKFKLEAIYQKISAGGAISYVEIPNMRHNIEAIEELIKFIYENMQYAEFNTKSDYCSNCGFDGEIELNDELKWECPQCHCTDMSKLTVTRRTCGYLGQDEWNVGKTKEINDRVVHLY